MHYKKQILLCIVHITVNYKKKRDWEVKRGTEKQREKDAMRQSRPSQNGKQKICLYSKCNPLYQPFFFNYPYATAQKHTASCYEVDIYMNRKTSSHQDRSV